MSDLHFINGHSFDHQGANISIGASGKYLTEWSYADKLHRWLDTPFTFDDAYNLHLTKQYITADTLALEFHLNSFNSAVSGYEVLILANDIRSLKVANIFIETMKKLFPLRRNRGIKILTSDDRGYNNLLRLKKLYKQAMITEMFFLNTPDDWMTLEETSSVINKLNTYLNKGGINE